MGAAPHEEWGYASAYGYAPPAPAFEDLIRRHRSDLRRFIARRLSDHSLVDDVMQDTLLRAYRARSEFDLRRPVWPWLATIAKNTVLNAVRDERARRRLVEQETDWKAVEGYADPRLGNDPARRFASKEQRAAIRVSLDALEPRQRRLLLMRAAEGLSYQEIARSEGLSVNAVKSLLKRTRRAFRERYDRFGIERGAMAGLPLARTRAWIRLHAARLRARVGYVVHSVRYYDGIDALVQVLGTAGLAGVLLLSGLAGVGEPRVPSQPLYTPTIKSVQEHAPSATALSAGDAKRTEPLVRKTIEAPSEKGNAEVSLAGTIDRSGNERRSGRIQVDYKVPGRDEGEEAFFDIPCAYAGTETPVCSIVDRAVDTAPRVPPIK